MKNRQNILLEIQEAQDLQEWKDRMDSTLECLATNKDVMLAKTYLAEKEKFKTKKEKQLKRIKEYLCYGKSLFDIPIGKYNILGWCPCKYSYLVVLEKEGICCSVLANNKLEKRIIPCIQQHFFTKEEKKKTYYWFTPYTDAEEYFNINIYPKSILNVNGKSIPYVSINLYTPAYIKLTNELLELQQEEEKLEVMYKSLFVQELELPDDKDLLTRGA